MSADTRQDEHPSNWVEPTIDDSVVLSDGSSERHHVQSMILFDTTRGGGMDVIETEEDGVETSLSRPPIIKSYHRRGPSFCLD